MITNRPINCCDRTHRRGFTLVELLVVMMIISVMAALSMAALNQVQKDAQVSRTRAQITKINELLMNRWNTYQTRSVPLSVAAGTDPQQAAGLRLAAIRELMRMELPDRKTDLIDSAVSGIPAPSLWRVYRRRVFVVHGDSGNPADPWPLWTIQYQGAECLYLILSAITEGESNGLDFFKSTEIGDLDGDGMLEVLDTWGNPIEFLRWAPGFTSPLQLGDTQPLLDGNTGDFPDPFDPLKVDPHWIDGLPENDPFAIYPLIYSAGQDKSYDVVTDYPLPIGPLRYANLLAPSFPNDPYYVPPATPAIGTEMDANADGKLSAADNIHNHLLQADVP